MAPIVVTISPDRDLRQRMNIAPLGVDFHLGVWRRPSGAAPSVNVICPRLGDGIAYVAYI
jgi:hypothetical protein